MDKKYNFENRKTLQERKFQPLPEKTPRILKPLHKQTSVAEQKFAAGYEVHPQHFEQLGNNLNKPVA